jgi:hypothetical protein
MDLAFDDYRVDAGAAIVERIELILGASWATKPKPTKPQDALQVRKPYPDLLALTSRRLEAVGARERPGDVPGVLMDIPRDLAWWLL